MTQWCERGVVKVGDEIPEIQALRPTQTTIVTGVEMFRKVLDEGSGGDNIGVLLRGTEEGRWGSGMVLALKRHPHTKFGRQIWRVDEGRGQPSYAALQRYRPQFYFGRRT